VISKALQDGENNIPRYSSAQEDLTLYRFLMNKLLELHFQVLGNL
jgi:hypothetical protein